MRDLICSILDAGFEPERWQAVLPAISETLGGASVVLCHDDVRSVGRGSLWSFRCDDSVFRDLPDELWRPENNELVDFALRAPVGQAFDRRQCLPDGQIERSPFGVAFFNNSGMFHMTAALVQRDEDTISVAHIGRERQREPFRDDELRLADELFGYIGHAMRTGRALRRSETRGLGFAHALDCLKRAVLLCDGGLRLWHSNTAAAAWFEVGDVVRVLHGRVRLASAAAQRQLEAATLALSECGCAFKERTIIVPRRENGAACAITAVPALGDAVYGFAPRAQVMLIISSTKCGSDKFEPSRLAQTFELTPAEARVASLACRALPLDEIARRSGVSSNTVKTQLRVVYSKFGVRNQVELVGIVSALLPAVSSGGIRPEV